jgi:hypothetical protein
MTSEQIILKIRELNAFLSKDSWNEHMLQQILRYEPVYRFGLWCPRRLNRVVGMRAVTGLAGPGVRYTLRLDSNPDARRAIMAYMYLVREDDPELARRIGALVKLAEAKDAADQCLNQLGGRSDEPTYYGSRSAR